MISRCDLIPRRRWTPLGWASTNAEHRKGRAPCPAASAPGGQGTCCYGGGAEANVARGAPRIGDPCEKTRTFTATGSCPIIQAHFHIQGESHS